MLLAFRVCCSIFISGNTSVEKGTSSRTRRHLLKEPVHCLGWYFGVFWNLVAPSPSCLVIEFISLLTNQISVEKVLGHAPESVCLMSLDWYFDV